MKSLFLIGIFILRLSVGQNACAANHYVQTDECAQCGTNKSHYTIQHKLCKDYSKCEEEFCEAGKHSNGSGSCIECTSNKWTIYGSFSSKASASDAAASCTQCKQNYKKATNGDCQTCPVGKSHMAGDTGTDCSATECPAGMLPFGHSGLFGCANCWGSSDMHVNSNQFQVQSSDVETLVNASGQHLSYGSSYANPYGGQTLDIDTNVPFMHLTSQSHSSVAHWAAIFNTSGASNAFMGKYRKCNNCKVGTYFSIKPPSSPTVGGKQSTCKECTNNRWNYGRDFSITNIAGTTKSKNYDLFDKGQDNTAYTSDELRDFGNYQADTAASQDCSFCKPNFHFSGPQGAGQCIACGKGKSNLFGGYNYANVNTLVPFRHDGGQWPSATDACVDAACGANWKLTSATAGGCVKCQSGKTKAAGSNSSTADDAIDCANAICGPNEHVTTRLFQGAPYVQCEQCPVGYGNAQGDNAFQRLKSGVTDATHTCKTLDDSDADNFKFIDNGAPTIDIKFSDWAKPLWKATEPWYTHCDGCAANYHVQADTHACVTCDSGKSSSPAANRWLAATECQQVATTVDDDSTGVLIGAVCGGIAGVALLGVAAYCCKKKRT